MFVRSCTNLWLFGKHFCLYRYAAKCNTDVGDMFQHVSIQCFMIYIWDDTTPCTTSSTAQTQWSLSTLFSGWRWDGMVEGCQGYCLCLWYFWVIYFLVRNYHSSLVCCHPPFSKAQSRGRTQIIEQLTSSSWPKWDYFLWKRAWHSSFAEFCTFLFKHFNL